jgi:hypothetical protein
MNPRIAVLPSRVIACTVLGCCFGLTAGVGVARAESPEPASASAVGAPDLPPRPWLYLDDPSVPTPMHVFAFSRATYTKGGADSSPTRPFGANLSRAGGTVELGAEVGLLSKLSLAASGFGGGDQLGVGALAGLRFAPLEGLSKTTHAVVSGGWLHELNGGDGAWMRVAVSQEFDRLRLGATAHAEHVFATRRDSVDFLFMAGASYAVAGPLRLGLEYVAQDLEESLSDEAEGGVRQFLAPQASVELLEKRLSLAGGPAFGLNAQSPAFSGRLAVAYEY